MLERTEEIIGGASYLVKMFGVDKAIIGVEDNKKNGIDALNRVIAETKAPVIVVPLHCRYPQGGESSSARPSPASRCPRRPAQRHRLRRVQHQHDHRHLPRHHDRYARCEQGRHRIRLRRDRAEERRVPHRHPPRFLPV